MTRNHLHDRRKLDLHHVVVSRTAGSSSRRGLAARFPATLDLLYEFAPHGVFVVSHRFKVGLGRIVSSAPYTSMAANCALDISATENLFECSTLSGRGVLGDHGVHVFEA
jgi:hypothetical protein